MLQHLCLLLSLLPTPFHIFRLDLSEVLFFGGPLLMDLWPGLCSELPLLEPGAGLNSIPVCVLSLHNQSRPPPYRARACRRPHPSAGSGIPRGLGRPGALGRGSAAATARPDTTWGWLFFSGVVGAPGSSTFSLLSCFWFRPLQTNHWQPLGPMSIPHPPNAKWHLFFPVCLPLQPWLPPCC